MNIREFLKKMKINVVAHARCIFSLFDIFSVTALNDGTRKSPCVNGCLMSAKQKKKNDYSCFNVSFWS